jgi:hypothetical protein
MIAEAPVARYTRVLFLEGRAAAVVFRDDSVQERECGLE